MTAKPKYYFNLDGNITDGEKEYSLYNIEDVVGGLSISSDLKERYVLYGRNSLLDLLNELNDKCEVLEIENESFEDGATRYAELYHKSLKENEQLKQSNEDARHILKREFDFATEQRQKHLDDPVVTNAYDIIRFDMRKALDKLGWLE